MRRVQDVADPWLIDQSQEKPPEPQHIVFAWSFDHPRETIRHDSCRRPKSSTTGGRKRNTCPNRSRQTSTVTSQTSNPSAWTNILTPVEWNIMEHHPLEGTTSPISAWCLAAPLSEAVLPFVVEWWKCCPALCCWRSSLGALLGTWRCGRVWKSSA